MKTSGRKIVSLCLVIVLTFGLTISASARASNYFDRAQVSTSAAGNGKVSIKLDVSAANTMQEVGATQIIVYEKQASGSYQSVFTFKRADYPNLIAKNRASIVTYVTYQGTPGKTYYVTANCYAKDARGSDATWAGSRAVKV